MAEERVQRRLAAILAADVVGYSRLMGEDETGTRTQFNEHLSELIEPTIARQKGRIVKMIGDGLLVEFSSVVDAVQCAVEIQKGMVERNTGRPNDRHMTFRIGINLGDVIIEGDDIHGDGVNIAARLEALADPGGICISGTVFDQVGNKLELPYKDLGAQSVKNIAEPVRTYRVGLYTGNDGSPSTAPVEDRPLPLPDKPSIAVLPFSNMSADPEQEYFSDGITEDIITDLSTVSALFVIARNSSFSFKGESVDVRHVASQLGVRYVLEGSVRKVANRVRITAQLIDGKNGGHIWADRYDRNLDDIFQVQDEVTRQIVDALKVRLAPGESERIGNVETSNMEAYDLTLRARELALRYSPESNVEARKLLEKVVELDPNFSSAVANLAVVYFVDYLSDWNDATEANLDVGHDLALKAIELNPNDPQAYWALALAYQWKGDLDRALETIDRAITLEPNHATAYGSRGYILSFAGRPDEAVESLEKSIRHNPQGPSHYLHFLGHAYLMQKNYEKAIETFKRRIRLYPETDSSRVLLASCLGHLGRLDEARSAWTEALEINPNYSLDQKKQVLPYKFPADWERIVDGLRKAGLPK